MSDAIVHTDAPRLKGARAVVFLSSFCLMTIELVAGRVMAPYLGVSLYTWTSVIAMVLLGVTVGNYMGGRLADRKQSHVRLGLSFIFAGIASLVILLFAPVVGAPLRIASWPLWLSSLIFSLAIFSPAAFFLSTVSPQVVKFDLHDLEKTGATLGSIGAWSAAGSIAGTFTAGFVFLMYVGTRHLVIALAATLVLIGLLVAFQSRLFRPRS